MPVLLRVLLVSICGFFFATGSAPAQSAEELRIPVPGTGQSLVGRLCRPVSPSSAPLVVIAHGSPANGSERPGVALKGCGEEAAQWFLMRGYAVVFALRRGYGATGGPWAEGYGSCARPDYVHAGLETARDIDATVAYATALPGIRRDGAVVVGQSAGGWGAIAYDSRRHGKVSAFIVMAGGRGGHHDGEAGSNCSPEALAAAAGRFGRTSRTPMLWIYAENDSFFGPDIAEALDRSFTAAGGRVSFVQTGPYGRDGHGLFFGAGGSSVWGPAVEQYLTSRAR